MQYRWPWMKVWLFGKFSNCESAIITAFWEEQLLPNTNLYPYLKFEPTSYIQWIFPLSHAKITWFDVILLEYSNFGSPILHQVGRTYTRSLTCIIDGIKNAFHSCKTGVHRKLLAIKNRKIQDRHTVPATFQTNENRSLVDCHDEKTDVNMVRIVLVLVKRGH